MTSKTLSKYKWKRLATEALLNALRLHKDAVMLFQVGSYPSAYQLSVLCLEEFAKAKWVEHYYYSCITNTGFPPADFEQGFLKLLYMHGQKQYAFIAQDLFEYPPEFADFIKGGGLDRRKQRATYVGLDKTKKEVDVGGRISVPKTITMKEARRLISWINTEFLFVHKNLKFHEYYFGIDEMDSVMLSTAADVIFQWPHKSRLRSRKHQVAHQARYAEEYRIAQQQWLAKSNAVSEGAPKDENICLPE